MTQTEISFDIGDRVIATKTIDGNNLTGKYGTVVSTGDYIGVQFDERIPGGHDCRGQGTLGYCWFCYCSCLQIVRDDEVEFEESADLLDFIQSFARC